MTIEEAIDRLKNAAWLGSDEDRESTEQAVEMAVEALSTAREWTPVSERLPELTIHKSEPFIGEWDDSEPVLVYSNDEKRECKYLVAEYTNGFADVGESPVYGWVDVNDGDSVEGVLAWMPMPEPYEGGDAE